MRTITRWGTGTLIVCLLIGCAATPTTRTSQPAVGLRQPIPKERIATVQEQLIALVRSSGFERNNLPMDERWTRYTQGPHVMVEFHEPRTIAFNSASRRPVVATQLMFPISSNEAGPYVFARHGDEVRAFAMYDQKLADALRKTLSRHVW